MFKRVGDEQREITRGWAEVEDAVGSLRGRKFYGVFDETRGEYRVCVQVREGDDAAAPGLETGTLPGGRYAQVPTAGRSARRLRADRADVESLAVRADRDPSRPGIEFYRRHDVIDLLLPVT